MNNKDKAKLEQIKKRLDGEPTTNWSSDISWLINEIEILEKGVEVYRSEYLKGAKSNAKFQRLLKALSNGRNIQILKDALDGKQDVAV